MSIVFNAQPYTFGGIISKPLYISMKRIFLFLALIYLCTLLHPAMAQAKKLFIYGELGIGLGNFSGGKFALNTIFDNNIITAGFWPDFRRSPQCPADYSSLFSNSVSQTITTFGLLYGKVLYTHNNAVRYTFKGGIGGCRVVSPSNFVRQYNTWFGPNYSFERREETSVPLILNPSMELPYSRGFGFNFGIYGNVNLISPSVAVEANMIFGYLRKRHKHARNN